MLLIECPWCGPRDQREFTYGGDATEGRALDPLAPGEAAAQVAALYLRDNPRGPHREFWQHHAGCRAWLRVRRDTLTHEITATEPAGPRYKTPPFPEDRE